MSLIIPRYIKELNIAEMENDFEWDDPEGAEFEVPMLYNQVCCFYSRFKLGLAISLSEWVFWRLNKVSDPIFEQFIEASWAGLIDRRYLKYKSNISYYAEHQFNISENPSYLIENFSDDDLFNKNTGPLLMMVEWLGRAVDRTTSDASCSAQLVYLSNLARQVIGKSKVRKFRAWRRVLIENSLIPDHLLKENEDDFLGPAVPREIFDPTMNYEKEERDTLVKRFIERVDYTNNPFLVSPTELKALGFIGIPYTFEGTSI